MLTDEDKQEIAEIAAGMVDVPEGGGGGAETGFELVSEFRTQEEVAEFSFALDESLDDSYVVVMRFNGTETNTKKYKPIITANGTPYRYLEVEALYNSATNGLWSFAEIKSMAMMLEWSPKSFSYNTDDTFQPYGYTGTIGGHAYQVRSFANRALPLISVGEKANGGVFGVGTAVRIYKIKGV